MALSNSPVTTIASNVYVSSGTNGITTMYFANYGSSSVTFNLYAIPAAGGVAGNATVIYPGVPIASNDTFVVDVEKLVLASGDRLMANCSSNTVTATFSTMGL